MITRMKKITVICIREHQEATLMALQEMGALHLEHVQETGSTLLDEARAHWMDVRRACEVLSVYHGEKSDVPVEPTSSRKAEVIVDEVWKLLNHRRDFEESRERWLQEVARMEPFGSFDPKAVHALAANDIHVRLFKAGPEQVVEAPDDAVLTEHGRDRQGRYFSLISRTEPDLPYETVRLPEHSLEQMRRMVQDLDQALADNEKKLRALTGYLPAIRDIADQVEDRMYFLEARTGMGQSKPLSYLRGYCPERNVAEIQKTARIVGWGLLIEEVGENDHPPTKIENPKWIEPIRTVFSFIGVVPGYHEVDISALFLLFFSIFFGMIVGDAGYGVLFLIGTAVAQWKFRKVPSSVFHLLYITSLATVLWGALTGNYFGIAGALPAPLAPWKLDWLTDTRNLMLLCFLIGAIHLTLAHLWNLIRTINSPLALAQAGWICVVWTMFFAARSLVLSAPFPPIMGPVLGIGLILLIVFMTPLKSLKAEWFNHVMLPLSLVNNFVDVVSYVRLFAVGTATLAVASAFNGMGGDIASGGHWASSIAGALVIFIGHTLNILLAIMGVLVHGIRLNTLEFAGHMGLQWTGIRYEPFKRKSARVTLFGDEIKTTHN